MIRPGVVATILLLLAVPGLVGQPAPEANAPQQDDTGDGDPLVSLPVSPGGAFLRSLAVPGWGQAAAGSHTRAGFYFLTSGATLFMNLKTAHYLDAAEDRLAAAEREVERELAGAGEDPAEIPDLVEADERVQEIQGLVDSRSQQMEDWMSFGIFWLLLNAADAFVSAHLADFPEPVDVELRPGSSPGGAELRLSVPLGGGTR